MQALRNFFIFCSGSYVTLLKRTPSDVNKHAGIGATIFFTGVFAAIAASFALYSVFHNYWVASIFGIFWGLLIFNLDRYIVMSMKKQGNFMREIATATPRLLLAVLIAFVISKPLELKLFQSEIEGELTIMEQELRKDQEAVLKDRFDEDITKLESDILALNLEVQNKRTKRDELNLLALQEADGTGGSQKRNMGPIYKAKKAEADEAQTTLDNTIAELSPIIQEKRTKILDIEAEKETQITEMTATKLDGFAAQIDALGRLSHKSRTIWYASLFITLLFIAIETAPIFTKLISHKSPFDFKLSELEHQYHMGETLKNTRLETKVRTQLDLEIATERFKKDELSKAENEIIKNLVAQELEKIKGQPISWKEYLKGGRYFGV